MSGVGMKALQRAGETVALIIGLAGILWISPVQSAETITIKMSTYAGPTYPIRIYL